MIQERLQPRLIFHPDVLSEPYKISVNPRICAETLIAAGLNKDLIDKIKIVIAGRGKATGVYYFGVGEIYIFTGTRLDKIAVPPMNAGSVMREIEEAPEWLEEDVNKTLAHESKHASEDASLNNPLSLLLELVSRYIPVQNKKREAEVEQRAKEFERKFSFSDGNRAITITKK